MTEEYPTTAQPNFDRRGLLAGSAVALVGGKAHAEAASDAGPTPESAKNARGEARELAEARELSGAWADSLALQAATYAAPIVAMYKLSIGAYYKVVRPEYGATWTLQTTVAFNF